MKHRMPLKLQIKTFETWLNRQGIYEDNNMDWYDKWKDNIDPTWHYNENFHKLTEIFKEEIQRNWSNKKWKKYIEEVEYMQERENEQNEYFIQQKLELEEDFDLEDLTEQRERPIGITSYYTQEQKEMIEMAASLKNQSLSSFIKEIILNHCKK